jgi:hypothetical protein
LRAGEGCGAQAACASDNRTDSCAFAAAENSAEQCACPCADGGVNERGFSAAAGFDCAFHVHKFARRSVIELHDFRGDGSALAIGHHQAVEDENHRSVPAKAAGIVDRLDRTVHASSLVHAVVHHGGAEGIALHGIFAGEGVVHADAERCPLRDAEAGILRRWISAGSGGAEDQKDEHGNQRRGASHSRKAKGDFTDFLLREQMLLLIRDAEEKGGRIISFV